ncbi:phage tail protein [Pseudomonas aeruginosa]|nr:phage tail protein [Pseudomonas aeruginosa]MCU9088412.1 phage tail protein [Pseudomonas aeruginosa]
MGASITLAGESLIAQKHVAQEGLDVVRFIFANVPGLDHSGPVDRAAGKPPANQIVYTATIPENGAGYVNPNQVVYSVQAGSDVGDWDFNWIGLETAENVLFAVSYVPIQQKRKNIPPLQIGNNLTRNFLVVFDGAQALTGLTIDASTWQHDFTVRLAGIDERQRQSNRNTYGRACFFGSSLQLEKVGSVYQLKTGTAYVEGIRVERSAVLPVAPPALPTTAWLDVALQRELNDVVASWSVVFGANKVDYVDSAGAQHYCVALADIPSTVLITDRRPVEPISGSLVEHFAARIGDYAQLRARATTKDDVGLGNLPNAKSDDTASNDSQVLATTKLVFTARAALQAAIDAIISGATVVGKAAKLATARTINGVAFDGSANITIADGTKEPAIAAGTSAQYWRGTKAWADLATDIRAAVLTGLSTATSTAIVATDSVLVAFGKLQAQVSLKLDATASAISAAKLATARTISLTGDVTGSVAFDGSGNVSMVTAVADDSHAHVIANVDGLQAALDAKLASAGGTVTGNLTVHTGVDGGYGSSNSTGTGWGACIWGMGPAYDGAGANTTYDVAGHYGASWLRGSHGDAHANIGEGLYVFQGGVLKGGIGSAGIYTPGIFYGNGSGLTSLNASNLASGTIPDARIPGLAWSKITSGKPTTIGGYGITDAYVKTDFADRVVSRGNNANGYYRVWSSGMKEMYIGALTVNAPSIILNLPIALNALYGANARATILSPGISSTVVAVNFLSTSQIQVFCAQSANIMIAIAGDM